MSKYSILMIKFVKNQIGYIVKTCVFVVWKKQFVLLDEICRIWLSYWPTTPTTTSTPKVCCLYIFVDYIFRLCNVHTSTGSHANAARGAILLLLELEWYSNSINGQFFLISVKKTMLHYKGIASNAVEK